MQIPVLLDRSRREPLPSQLVEQLRDAIRQRADSRAAPGCRRRGVWPSNSRCRATPSIRAYDALIVEGYVESRPASGMFVADALPDSRVKTAQRTPERRHAPARYRTCRMPPLPLRAQNLVDQNRSRLSFDFFPGRPSAGAVSAEDLAPAAASQPLHGGAAGCRNTATRPACRRCAPRSRTISRRRAASSPIRAASSSSAASRRASTSRRGSSSSRHAERDRGPLLSGRGLRVRGDRLRGRRRRRSTRRACMPDELPRAARRAALSDAVAPISDRAHAVARAPGRASSPGRGATAATSSRTITTAIFATKDRRCRRSRRMAPDCTIYLGTFSRRSAPGCGSATSSRRRSSPKRCARRRRCSTTAIPGSNRRRSPK